MNKIAIHSVPRSGSSWLGEIVNSSPGVLYRYQPLFSYRFKSYLDEHSDAPTIAKFFREIEKTSDEFIEQAAQRDSGAKPYFKKDRITHIAYKEVRYHYVLDNLLKKGGGIKLILLVRNPLAVLSSFKNAEREFRFDLGWDFDQEWRYAERKNLARREEYFGYEKWKECTLLFEQLKCRYSGQVMLVKYDDLIKDALSTTEKLFRFSGLPMCQQTIDFIVASGNRSVAGDYSVYRQKRDRDNSWQNYIGEEIVAYIKKDLKGTALEKYIKCMK